jgi:hypothetical protein
MRGDVMNQQDLKDAKLAALELLLQMLYAKVICSESDPLARADAWAQAMHDTMSQLRPEDEAVPEEVEMIMTSVIDDFFEGVKGKVLERMNAAKK